MTEKDMTEKALEAYNDVFADIVNALIYKGEQVVKPFVSDYKINLFEIAYLSDEQLSYFKSDFWCVADYLIQMERTGTGT